MGLLNGYVQSIRKQNGEEGWPSATTMESDQKLMGIPQLVHFQTLITTGALFLGLMAVKLISSEASTNNIAVTVSIAILALLLLIGSSPAD